MVEQGHASLLAEMLDQGFAQIVLPASRDANQRSLEFANVDFRDARMTQAHHDQDAGQGRLRKMHLELGRYAVVGLGQRCLHAFALVGVVVLAGDVDQAGDEASEGVGADEQADALPLAEAKDPDRIVEELVYGGLEQLVARVLLENRHQRLAGMALGHETGMFDHRRDLASQQRDALWIGVVGGRREQADDPTLAGDLALLVEGLDADVVEITLAVDGRTGIGLGDRQ